MATSIDPHKGYWVKVQQNGELILNAGGGATGAVQIVETSEMPPDAPSLTGVEDGEITTTFALEQNYPNPFNPSTTIRYSLPERSQVTLAVFNTLGQQVALLQNGEEEEGYHEVKFDGSKLASGVYLYRMQAGSCVETKKLLLVK